MTYGGNASYFVAMTDETPEISFRDGTLSINGRSIPEDAKGFYSPVISHVDGWCTDGRLRDIEVCLEYFNKGTSSELLYMFMALEDGLKCGTLSDAEIRWRYDEDDDCMREAGLEYSDLVDVAFRLIEMADS